MGELSLNVPKNSPLVVDLDRTLVLTDTLVEHFLLLFLRSPWQAILCLFQLIKGKAAFKEAVAESVDLYRGALLFNPELLAYLREQKLKGRALHLVTASNQKMADLAAAAAGVFDSATGTSSAINLKGKNKLAHLQKVFPEGFCYAGDCSADLVIWEQSDAAVVVGADRSTREALSRLSCPIELSIDRSKGTFRDWRRLLRVHQWSKNVLLLVPLLLGHKYFDLPSILSVLVGFIAMGLVASGTYIINDINDLIADRAHATKRRRPVASGVIEAGPAAVVAVALVLGGLIVMASLSVSAAGWLLLYLVATLSYSCIFKRQPMIDVFILGGLYTLRLVIGACLAGAEQSHWLLMFSFFFFFSLSMAKRHVEIVKAVESSNGSAVIKGRGYRTSDVPLTLAFGVGTCLVAVLILGLYVAFDINPQKLYRDPEWLWGVVVLVMVWSSRIWLLSHRGVLDDDPVSFAIRDRISLLIGLVVVVLFALSIA
ncbi:UbiA family prenyltransferase [Asaia astilbis]